MNQTSLNWMRSSLVVIAAVAFFTGCAGERALGPDQLSSSVSPDLGTCQQLQVPEGSKLVFHVFATGVQIYRWNGTTWSFVAPLATLSADAGGKSVVGIHYAGPTWESNSGSKVVGTVSERCTPNPDAIPWLLLTGVSVGPGIFHRVTHIQRVNTVGGLAPSTPGSFTGEEVRVPYTTEYFFYRTP